MLYKVIYWCNVIYLYMPYIGKICAIFYDEKTVKFTVTQPANCVEHETESYFYVLVAFSFTSCYNLPRFGILLLRTCRNNITVLLCTCLHTSICIYVGVRTIASEEHCPPIRDRVWVSVSVRARVVCVWGGRGAIFLSVNCLRTVYIYQF